METVRRIDSFAGRYIPWFILGAAVLGVAFPPVFAPLHSHLTLLLALLTFANSLSGGFRELADAFRNPRPILTAFVVMHLVMPALVLGMGRVVFSNNPDFVSGLVLQFTLPVGVATLMWVGMSGGRTGLCLSMVLMDTLLSPFTIPLTLKLLLGTAVEMDVWGMMRNLLLMVGIPALLGMTLHDVRGGRAAKTLKPLLALPGKVVILLIVATTGSQCADFFLGFDRWMLLVLCVVVTLTIFGFWVGHLTAKGLRLEFPAAFTLTVMIGFRNISAGIVLAQQYFPVEALLPVAIVPLFQNLLMSIVIKVLWRTKDARTYLARQAEE